MLLSLYRSLYSYRGFILGSVKREFQSRYRNSLFGALWTVLNPLSMIVVYTVIFSQIMRARLPGVDDGLAYSVYLCAGLLTWGLFAEITSRSQGMFLENANLLKKISFPRICLPVIALLNAGINFAIILGLFFGFLLISGRLPGMALLALVALQLGTGLISDDEIAFTGPLYAWVDSELALKATSWHRSWGQWLLLGMIGLHLAAILFYRLRGTDLVRPMLGGDKLLPAKVPASRDDLRARALALAIVAAAVALAAWVGAQGG